MARTYDSSTAAGNRYEPVGPRIGIRDLSILHQNTCECAECDTYRAVNGYRPRSWKSLDLDNGLLYPDSPPRPLVVSDVQRGIYHYSYEPRLVRAYDAAPPRPVEGDVLELFNRMEDDD